MTTPETITAAPTAPTPAAATASSNGAASAGGPPPPRHWSGVPASSRWVLTARHLAPQLAASSAEFDRRGAFAADSFALAGREGLLSMLVPSELGGGGASHAEACRVLAELARGCPATSLSLSMHSHLVAAQVWRHHRAMPAPVLTKVASDTVVLISTGAADWIDSGGCATKVDGGFRITARKSPSSACPAGTILITSARWEEGPDGPSVIHAAVPFSTAGVRIEETWNTMGMRATGSHTVVLDDVFVPDDAVSLVRPVGRWHPVWSTVLGAALPLIMATYVGVAEEAASRALALAAPKAGRADVAPTAGRLLDRLTTAQDVLGAMIASSDDLRFDNTVEFAATALARKTVVAEAAIDTVRLALELVGGRAFGVEAGLERLYRDVHGALYHPLPAAQQQVFTGRVALGLDPIDPSGSS